MKSLAAPHFRTPNSGLCGSNWLSGLSMAVLDVTRGCNRCFSKPLLPMRNLRNPLVILITAVPVFLLLAQANRIETFERGFRPHVAQGKIGSVERASAPEPRIFHINGVAFRSWMSGDSLRLSPDWAASQPIPLRFDRLEEIARQELAKLVADDSSWSVTSFQLHSIPEDQALKWYFVVEMKPFWEPGPPGPDEHHDSFCVHIDLSGRPGFVTQHFSERQR